MPEEVKEQLEGLRDITNADSMSEVIRRAIAVYDFLWGEKAAGGVTVVRDKDGKERQLLLL
jgi:Ribbon-helix-helix protein, copG family